MPTFKITAPDGTVYKVTGDNDQGALVALREHLNDTDDDAPRQPRVPKRWAEVTASDAFKALSPDDQEAARN